MGREMKGETVRGIWARRGWDSGNMVSVSMFVGGSRGKSLLLLYMVAVMRGYHNARSIDHAVRKQGKG